MIAESQILYARRLAALGRSWLYSLGDGLARAGSAAAAPDLPSATTISAASSCDLTRSDGVQHLYNDCRLRLREGVPCLQVDLSHVTQIDTKLVAALIALKRYGLATGQRVEVLCSDPVRAWLRVCRLESELAVRDGAGADHRHQPGAPEKS